MFGPQLMEEVCERSNLQLALKRVRQNGGAPGVDGMSVSDLRGHLKENWPVIKQQLLEGSYQPIAVRRVRIPKPTGTVNFKIDVASIVQGRFSDGR